MALVTGGGGYLGNRLCKELLERGYEVTALDVNYFSDWEEGNSRIKQIKVSFFFCGWELIIS